MKKKDIESFSTINMDKFLREYCKVDNEELIDLLSRLSHKEIKQVFEDIAKINLRSIAFDEIDKEDLMCGDVILVHDAYFNAAPYLNLEREKTLRKEKVHDKHKRR